MSCFELVVWEITLNCFLRFNSNRMDIGQGSSNFRKILVGSTYPRQRNFSSKLCFLSFLSTKPWPVEIYLNLSEPKIVFLETSFPPSFDPWNAFPSFHFPSANIELKSNEDFHGLCRLQSCIAVFGKGNFLHSKIIPTISTHYFHIFLFTLLFPQFIPVHEVHRFPLHNQRMNPRKISSYWEYPTFWPQFTLVVMSKTFNISYF